MSNTIRILVLEDSQDDAELLAHSLRSGGIEFQWKRVETEEEFLAQLQWPPDLVLADYRLPQTNASEALRILRKIGLSVPFIVVSGAIGEEMAAEMIKQGATDYLLKDRLARLPSAVIHALRERKLLQEKEDAEERMRRNDARLLAFIEHAPFGVCCLDTKTEKFLTMNPALVRLLGYSSESELSSLRLSDVHTGKNLLENVKHNPTFAGIETRCIRKDGKPIIVLLSGRLICEEEREVIETVVYDVTQQRLLEDQLRESQKMEAMGQLAGGVAHDFNNLLSVIMAHCGLLRDELGPHSPFFQRVLEIQNTSQHAARLVSQLLTFSRKQPRQPRVLDLNSIVSEAAVMLRRTIREDIELSLALAKDLGCVKADPTQIMQILINLATNARDAMPCGGCLKIETRNVVLQESGQHASEPRLEGRYVLLEVMDTGTGMDEKTRAHVFEPFFTTKEAFGSVHGTGLGLSTVYGIVRQSGGQIFVDSQVGKGSTFRIYLPLVEAGVDVDHAAHKLDEQAQPTAATILLVEDEKLLGDLWRKVLEKDNCTVLLARDSAEAFQLSENHHGPIHLLIADVMLPGISGPELAAQLVASRPAMKVLYTSGYSADILANAQVKGAFIQKPIEAAELRQKIAELLSSDLTEWPSGPFPEPHPFPKSQLSSSAFGAKRRTV